MSKIIGVTDFQRRFRKTFDEVAEDHIPYILTRGSRPEAVLLPYEDYLSFIRADEAGVLKRFDAFLARMAASSERFSEEEVEKDIAAAQKEYRAHRSRS